MRKTRPWTKSTIVVKIAPSNFDLVKEFGAVTLLVYLVKKMFWTWVKKKSQYYLNVNFSMVQSY